MAHGRSNSKRSSKSLISSFFAEGSRADLHWHVEGEYEYKWRLRLEKDEATIAKDHLPPHLYESLIFEKYISMLAFSRLFVDYVKKIQKAYEDEKQQYPNVTVVDYISALEFITKKYGSEKFVNIIQAFTDSGYLKDFQPLLEDAIRVERELETEFARALKLADVIVNLNKKIQINQDYYLGSLKVKYEFEAHIAGLTFAEILNDLLEDMIKLTDAESKDSSGQPINTLYNQLDFLITKYGLYEQFQMLDKYRNRFDRKNMINLLRESRNFTDILSKELTDAVLFKINNPERDVTKFSHNFNSPDYVMKSYDHHVRKTAEKTYHGENPDESKSHMPK